MRSRWIVVGIALLASAAALGWIGWRTREETADRRLLAQAQAEREAGRASTARSVLTQLVERRPDWDDAWYELGVCEHARGRLKEAEAAWLHIHESSPRFGLAAVHRSRLAMDRGQFSVAEDLLRTAGERPGDHQAEARWGMVLLLRLEGRFDEAKTWLEAGFHVMTSPEETLRRLYKLDHDPYPTEGVQKALERAGTQAPDDDRVWLGKGHLALRLNQLDEAESWLKRCFSRRTDDPACWRLRLDWALAAGRPDEVRACLQHIPASQTDPALASRLEAWLAERSGDEKAERSALERRLESNPVDANALERLAQIEIKEGRSDAAAALRARKTERDALEQRYRTLLGTGRPIVNASELADLANRLGREFDGARWADLAAGNTGRRPIAPLDPARRLADLIPESLAAPTTEAKRTPASPDRAAPIAFVDDAEKAGLTFTQDNGGERRGLIPPVTSSGGVGLLDYDGDGWLDVFFVQGGPFPPEPATPNADRLFRNRRDGTFEDVTERSGIAAMPGGYGHGVAVGDYDGDGRPDLFITRWRSYALYRNRGDGTFEDVTKQAGLDGDRDWPTSAAFADLDNDGDLDLYVCHYFRWDENEKRSCADPNDPTVYHCGPLDFDPLPDHVFRNDAGRFVDVTEASGCRETEGRGFGVVAADLDEDGKVDLFVANDMTADYLFHNQGGFKFVEKGLTAGVSSNATGAHQAGMGVACGDLDGDGRPDLVVTNFYNESMTYFHNMGDGFFGDESAAVGLAAPSRYLLGFGVAFLDADNDGRLDVMTANGHVFDGRPQYPWMMPVQFLRNVGEGRAKFIDASSRSGPPFEVLRMGRGLAAGDLDNDGRIDVVVVSQNQPAAYLHNRSTAGRFLTIQLEGTTSNRDAVGASVTVQVGARRLKAQRVGGGSFQSAGDPRLHFGLGTADRADAVEVRWPSGRIDRHPALQGGRGYRLVEGDESPKKLGHLNGGS
jgi:enediyne biosynthesis protein E4